MSTPEKFAASAVAGALEKLTKAMGVENKIGNAEAVRRSAPPRVAWVPDPKGRRRQRVVSQQRRDVKHVHEVEPLFLVHLWGRNYFAAEELERKLERALYDTFSPNAYAYEPGGDGYGDDPGGDGYAIVVPVRLLKIPLPVEIRQSVTLTGATAAGTLKDAGGDNPTDTGTITVP
jgi:hypothetical protein